jgi:hypothetical protein
MFAGCSAGEHMDEAGRQVQRFHDLYNQGSFAKIYQEGAPALKATGSEPQFAQFMAGIRGKLGAVKSSDRQGFNINFDTEGTQVTLTFRTQFQAGQGVENFHFEDTGSGKQLVSYHVNSDVLSAK